MPAILNSVKISAMVLCLTSCGETPPTEWIEVPLSEHTYISGNREFRQADFDILVLRNASLEFKLGLNQNDAITYSWTVAMEQPELLSAEFHGHTERVGEEPGTVMFYKIHNVGAESGSLVAPFDGIHGWYLDNQSDEDITVKLKVAGFFEELP